MKKLFILLLCLSWWQTVRPDPYEAGFVVTLVNGRSYTKNYRSHTIEYAQRGDGTVYLPVYWTSDAEKTLDDLYALDPSCVKGFESHSNPWVYNYIRLDPARVSSIDILDGGTFVWEPKHYGRYRLFEFAHTPPTVTSDAP